MSTVVGGSNIAARSGVLPRTNQQPVRRPLGCFRRSSETVLDSMPPHDSAPAGNSINAEAAVHGDPQAVQGAREIDLLVRLLAISAAATDEDVRYEPARIREVTIRTINASNVRSSRRNTRRSHRTEILQLMASVVLAHGLSSAEMLAQLLGDRIQADPDDWPVPLRLMLGMQLYDGGVTADWYSKTIAVAFRLGWRGLRCPSPRSRQRQRYATRGQSGRNMGRDLLSTQRHLGVGLARVQLTRGV